MIINGPKKHHMFGDYVDFFTTCLFKSFALFLLLGFLSFIYWFSPPHPPHPSPPHYSVWGILVPQPEIQPRPLAVRTQSPNYWTTREFPAY